MRNGNTAAEGYIEIKGSNGIWGGICDDQWDKPDADVVCRMLGWYFGAEIVYRQSTPFGHGGHGSFVFDDLACVGNETSVFDCPARPEGEENCGYGEWAGVKCALPCPGNGTCSNQGTCDYSTGNCTCDSGFYGPTCAGGAGKENYRGSCCTLSGWKTFSNLF